MLNSIKHVGRTLAATAVAALAGCGGGGGGAGAPVTVLPSSGSYAFALKAQGATTAPTFGISLVHPSAPGTEFVIEPATSAISDTKVVSSGTVAASTATISAIQPFALLYIVGGDVRRVPLVANGGAPAAQVQRAFSTTACKFLFDFNDYTTPANSRYMVSTAGADGTCGTADDGQAEVTLTTQGGISFVNSIIDPIIGMLRDPATLAPVAWIQGGGLYFPTSTPKAFLSLHGINNGPLLTRVVTQAYKSVVAEYNNQLEVLDFGGGSQVTETQLGALTTGTGWQSIGFDNANYYVYRNSGTTTASTWVVLKISKTTPAATQLASGTGLIALSGMGTNLLYLTVTGVSSNSLLALGKATAGTPQILENTATSTVSTVLTSNSGVHQLWRVTAANTATPGFTIEMIDELGNKIYTASGGLPMVLADAAVQNLNVSENRSRFVFASGYGTRQFGDASVVSYDAALKTATTLGALPGTADFGTDPVFATLVGSSTNFIAGFAARVTSGALQPIGAKVFSIDLSAPGSLKFTTLKQ